MVNGYTPFYLKKKKINLISLSFCSFNRAKDHSLSLFFYLLLVFLFNSRKKMVFSTCYLVYLHFIHLLFVLVQAMSWFKLLQKEGNFFNNNITAHYMLTVHTQCTPEKNTIIFFVSIFISPSFLSCFFYKAMQLFLCPLSLM